MTDKQKERANSMRPFVKYMNTRHLMPTRYSLDNVNELNPLTIKKEKAKDWDDQDVEAKKEACKAIKAKFEQRYNGGMPRKKETWFYEKLRF